MRKTEHPRLQRSPERRSRRDDPLLRQRVGAGQVSRRRRSAGERRHQSGRPRLQGRCRSRPRSRASIRRASSRSTRARTWSSTTAGGFTPRGAFTLHAYVFATTPAKGRQGLVTRWSERDQGRIRARARRRRARRCCSATAGAAWRSSLRGKPLLASVWYSIAAGFDPATGRAWIAQAPIVNSVNSLLGPVCPIDGDAFVEARADVVLADAGVPLVMAGWVESGERSRPIVGGHFNGKLDRPKIYGRAIDRRGGAGARRRARARVEGLLARWDFAAGIGPDGIATDRVADVSGNGLDGIVREPADARSHGLQLEGSRGELRARAVRVRRDPLPRRRPRGLRLGCRISSSSFPPA